MDAVNDVVLVISRETHLILDANSRAVEIYGYPQKKLVGMSMETLTRSATDFAKLLRKPLPAGALKRRITTARARGWISW